MSLCTVSGKLLDPSGTAVSGVEIDFTTQGLGVSIEPLQISTTTASDGTWSMNVVQGLSGVFTINVAPVPTARTIPYRFNVLIPAQASATFASVLED